MSNPLDPRRTQYSLRRTLRRTRIGRDKPLLVERLEKRLLLAGDVTASLGTLAPGKSITIAYEATVDADFPKGLDYVFNQATVTSDQPTTLSAPTNTPIDRAPQVTNVFVNGSGPASWTQDFRNELAALGVGDAQFGYAIPGATPNALGKTQLDLLTWVNVNEISIRFSEPVDIQIVDLQLQSIAPVTVTSFNYDIPTDTATWSLQNPIGSNKLRIILPSGVLGGVTDAAGNQDLDGNWIDGTADFNSGDGVAGDSFSFRFNVQPGNVSENGTTSIIDTIAVRNRQFQNIGDALYDIFHDVNGSGGINITDTIATRNNQFTSQPTTEPGGAPGSGWVPDAIPPLDPPAGTAGFLEVTKSVVLVSDVDGDNEADPGDTLHYTVTIANPSSNSSDANGVMLDDSVHPHVAVGNIGPAALPDSYATPENVVLTELPASGLLANDFDIDGGTFSTVGGVTAVGTVQGTLVLNGTAGGFTYTPPGSGFGFVDTFEYTIQDNDSLQSRGRVMFEVTAPIGQPPSAVSDGPFDVIGNVGIDVPAGAGVFGNDTLGIPAATISAFDATSLNGGDVTMNASTGAFTYTPAAGYTGTDQFDYTLMNASGSSTATVSVFVTEMIWFIDDSAGGGGDGRLNNPFNCLVGAGCFDPVAADAPGDSIFLASGSYTGGSSLLNSQQFVGEGASGASLDAVLGITLPANSNALPGINGTNPTITSLSNGINLASGNTIRGLTIGNTTGTGLNGTSVGAATVSDVTINGTGGGVNINTGILAMSFDEISSSNAAGINLSGVSGSFDVTTGTINSGSSRAVSISGVPVNLGVTLTSVSANGAANGIVLSSTTGSFTVTGDGSTATQGGNDTGGIIQNTSDDGIVLTNTQDITFQNMTIGDTAATPANSADSITNINGDGIDATNVTNLTLNNVTIARTETHGVRGVNVTNFTLDDSLVLNAGDGQEENGLDFTELRGDNFVTDSLFDAFNETGIEITNSSGTFDLTIDNTTFQDYQSTVGNAGEEAILLEASGSAQMVVKVTGTAGPTTNSIFDDMALQAIQAISSGASSDIQLTVENSRFLESSSGDAIIIMNPDNGGSGNLTVRNNFFTDDTFGPFAILAKNDSSGTLDVTVQGNTVNELQLMSINHDNLGSGGAANGTTRALIGGTAAGQGNVNTLTINNGISIDIIATETPATGSAPDLSLTIQNNTTSQPDGNFTFSPGLRMDIQQATRANINVSGNAFQGDPTFAGGSGIELRELDSAVVGLQGFGGGTAAAGGTFIDSNNPASAAASFVFSHNNNIGSGTATLPTATTQPSPLMAVSEARGVAAHLRASALAPIVTEAISRLAAGITDEQLALLNSTDVGIRDLPSNYLGYTSSQGHVIIDSDAAGHGWFVDITPHNELEFGTARARRDAQMDLLTVVLHELSHILGKVHTSDENDLLADNLVPGTRRLPAVHEAIFADVPAVKDLTSSFAQRESAWRGLQKGYWRAAS